MVVLKCGDIEPVVVKDIEGFPIKVGDSVSPFGVSDQTTHV